MKHFEMIFPIHTLIAIKRICLLSIINYVKTTAMFYSNITDPKHFHANSTGMDILLKTLFYKTSILR